MKFKEGDKIRIKSLNEIDKNDPDYSTLNTRLVVDFENSKGEIIKIKKCGAVEIDFSSKIKLTIGSDHVNLILKKDSHLPKELFEI